MNKSENSECYSLYEAILQLKNVDEVKNFIRDLCTPNEINAFEERWTLAQILDKKELSYRQINEKTGISTTTIARVARFLNEENYKGYRLVLDRLKGKE